MAARTVSSSTGALSATGGAALSATVSRHPAKPAFPTSVALISSSSNHDRVSSRFGYPGDLQLTRGGTSVPVRIGGIRAGNAKRTLRLEAPNGGSEHVGGEAGRGAGPGPGGAGCDGKGRRPCRRPGHP